MNKTIITNLNQFNQWWKSNKQSIMAFDTETTSLNYLDMNWIGCSFATNTAACYINLMYPEDISRYRLQHYFNDIKLLIMHNSVFDLKVLYKYGIKVSNIFCTLVGSQLLDENLSSHNLKYLAENGLKIPANQIKKWEEVSVNTNSKEFANYAMNDAIWAYQLYEIELKALKKQNLEHLFYNVEMPFQFVLRDLEINGILVDKEKLEEYTNECFNYINSIEHDMLALFGKAHITQQGLFGNNYIYSPINFNSPIQLIALIKDNLGFEITEETKEGNPSVGKVYLSKMRGKHKFFDLLWEYRKLQKLYNSFLFPLETFINSDGKVRPSYHMVRTGRLACSNPNLQQLPNPKKEKLRFNFRKIFIPEK